MGLVSSLFTTSRKAAAEDPFDKIIGTNGIMGAADTLTVLERTGGIRRISFFDPGA